MEILRGLHQSSKAEDKIIIASVLKSLMDIGELILSHPEFLNETQLKEIKELVEKLKLRLSGYNIYK